MAVRATTLDRDEEIERDCLDFIEAFYHEPDLELDDFCEAKGISRRTAQRALNYRGNSWRAMLTTVRMKEARRLLTRTVKPLTTIAEEVGYRYTKSFVAQYHRKYGEAPLATRKEARRGAR